MTLLEQLAGGVEATRKVHKKLHEVWELSFDWKDCRRSEFVWQKLNDILNNPCTGKWQLAVNAIEYIHSSARLYLSGVQDIYPVTNFMEMKEVNFNKSKE